MPPLKPQSHPFQPSLLRPLQRPHWASSLGLAASVLLLSLGLGGCAQLDGFAQVKPGLSTGADVQSRYGPPSRVWPEPEGGQTLEYASQPFGTRCPMITLDKDGHVTRIVDGLDPTQRARILPGMTPEQVSRILGRERSRVYFDLSEEDVWDWNIQPDQAGYPMRFNVHFKRGLVFRSSQSMVFPSRLGFGLGRD